MTKDSKLTDQIKLTFRRDDPDQLKIKFAEIHSKLGSKTSSESLRYCINCTYNMMINEDNSIKINNLLNSEIKKLITRPDIKSKYLISTKTDFVDKALNFLIQHIKNEIKSKSISHWDVISNLPSTDREIIKTLEDLQLTSSNKKCTVNEIAIKLRRRNKDAIKSILDKYVQNGQISCVEILGESYYHIEDLEEDLPYSDSIKKFQ